MFDQLVKVDTALSPERYFLALLLIGMFIFDYLFASSQEVEKEYTKTKGFIDAIIIIALFISVSVALDSSKESYILVPYILAFTKLFCLIWELDNDGDTFSLSIGYYFGFFILYALASYSSWQPFVFLVLLPDILISAKYKCSNIKLDNE